VVRFTLTAVSDLELADFSAQNVVAGLSVAEEGNLWRVNLLPCYGLAGHILCAAVAVSFIERSRGATEGRI
jgi:hypothetical protein